MGVSDFLSRVLDSAGRPVDLRAYTGGITERVGPNKRRRRPMRIGVDVSSWIHRAAHGYGDRLGDERHLTNYGRANLHHHQQQRKQNTQSEESDMAGLPEDRIQGYIQTCVDDVLDCLKKLQDTTKADILVVMDGPAPPIKAEEVHRRALKRREQEQMRDQPVDPMASPTKTNDLRTKAFRRAGAGKYFSRITSELLKGLRIAQIPFLVAPYEADGQLAYLSEKRYIDLVITEDSDLVAHGVRAILYKSIGEIGNERPMGKLLRFSDVGSARGSHWDLKDFTPVMMAVLFASVGCDYCEKLKGIGMLTASRIIRETFLLPKNPLSQRSTERKGAKKSKLSTVLEALYSHSYLNARTLTTDFKEEYEQSFLAAIFMYRHPVVFDPIQKKTMLFKRSHESKVGDNELLDHKPYEELCNDTGRIEGIVGHILLEEEATRAALGLERSRKPFAESNHPADKHSLQERTLEGKPSESTTVCTAPFDSQSAEEETMEQEEEGRFETQPVGTENTTPTGPEGISREQSDTA